MLMRNFNILAFLKKLPDLGSLLVFMAQMHFVQHTHHVNMNVNSLKSKTHGILVTAKALTQSKCLNNVVCMFCGQKHLKLHWSQ